MSEFSPCLPSLRSGLCWRTLSLGVSWSALSLWVRPSRCRSPTGSLSRRSDMRSAPVAATELPEGGGSLRWWTGTPLTGLCLAAARSSSLSLDAWPGRSSLAFFPCFAFFSCKGAAAKINTKEPDCNCPNLQQRNVELSAVMCVISSGNREWLPDHPDDPALQEPTRNSDAGSEMPRKQNCAHLLFLFVTLPLRMPAGTIHRHSRHGAGRRRRHGVRGVHEREHRVAVAPRSVAGACNRQLL